MSIISITLTKGGTGKTTTAVNLAAALSMLTKKVVLVDMDPSGDATRFCGITPGKTISITEVFSNRDILPQKAVIKLKFGVDLLAGDEQFFKIASKLDLNNINTVNSIIQLLTIDYEYIIIDSSPQESNLLYQIMYASDGIIIPVQTHLAAFDRIKSMIKIVRRIESRYSKSIKIYSIVPTMFQQQIVSANVIINQMNTLYGSLVFQSPIMYSVAHQSAVFEGLPLIISDPNHPASLSYTKLAREIIEKS